MNRFSIVAGPLVLAIAVSAACSLMGPPSAMMPASVGKFKRDAYREGKTPSTTQHEAQYLSPDGTMVQIEVTVYPNAADARSAFDMENRNVAGEKDPGIKRSSEGNKAISESTVGEKYTNIVWVNDTWYCYVRSDNGVAAREFIAGLSYK